ncbi:MAG: radical SAM protein [Turicibacter sp.]
MQRYNIITEKFPREIVLLKGRPCSYGKCTFCDYIEDNSTNAQLMNELNRDVLSNVKGLYDTFEVINSGNIFDLPKETQTMIKETIDTHNFKKLHVESHWIFRNHINRIREQYGIDLMVKTGVETFDFDFREKVLKKGAPFETVAELKQYFDSPCIMVGIKGQTKDMIKKDIDIILNNFEHATVNVYCENTTIIKPDPLLKEWFYDEYAWLDNEKTVEVLWNNTDFGVGD